MAYDSMEHRLTILEMEIKQVKTDQVTITTTLDKLDTRLRNTEKYMAMAAGFIVAVNIILKFIK